MAQNIFPILLYTSELTHLFTCILAECFSRLPYDTHVRSKVLRAVLVDSGRCNSVGLTTVQAGILGATLVVQIVPACRDP